MNLPEDIVDRVAAEMWVRTHDGCWEDVGDGQDESREIYQDDAAVAVAVIRALTETSGIRT